MASLKQLDQLLVKELRQELRYRHLKLGGSKEVLTARLRQGLIDEDEHPETYLFEIEPEIYELIVKINEGTDTTATALTCLLLVLIHEPDIQEKMWSEIHQHVGVNRLVTLADRVHMPYIQAVLLELLRYTSHVPLAVPHYTMCDTSVLDIPVPKNMTVYINLWALHHDPEHWPEPWTFKPERFLTYDGQLLPVTDPVRRRLMTFGAGRRVCLGEALAKNRLFLFATALVQSFEFQRAPDETNTKPQQLPKMDPRTYEMGLVLHPQHYQLIALARY